MRAYAFVAVIVVLASAVGTPAAEQSSKVRVGLLVHFDNKDVEAEATSYLSRELRSLGDVELVTSGADIVVATVGVGDDTLAVSTVVERAYHGDWVQKLGLEIALEHGKLLKEGQEIPASASLANPTSSATTPT